MQRQRRRWRFSTTLLIAFVASVVIVLLAALVATTPREARADREPPKLGAPTTTITSRGATSQWFAAPVLALFAEGDGDSALHPADGGPSLRVTVGRVRDGWASISGDGLTEGLEVFLIPYDEQNPAK